MRERFLLPVLLALAFGCKSEKVEGTSEAEPVRGAATAAPEPAPASATEEPTPVAPAADKAPTSPAAVETPSENAPAADGRRAALETAWRARACLLKRQDRTGGDEIDKVGGFKDAADFTAQWAAAAAADPAWATRVMTEAVTADCQPAAQ